MLYSTQEKVQRLYHIEYGCYTIYDTSTFLCHVTKKKRNIACDIKKVYNQTNTVYTIIIFDVI